MARLFEYQSKELLKQAGIPIPDGMVVSSAEEAAEAAAKLAKPVVLKAQVWATGRAEKGGIKFADSPEEASAALEALYLLERLGDTESCVYVSVVEEAELEKAGRRGVIDTCTPRDWLNKIVRGRFSLDYMSPEELACKVLRTREDVRRAVEYVIPLYEEKENLMIPSAYEAEVKEGFCIWRVKARSFKATIALP